MNKTQRGKCHVFLTANGWEAVPEEEKDSHYESYRHKSLCTIDMDDEELVFVDDTGDFLHLPLNYYALIGALIEYRQLAINYKSVK
jgi:hypothetical protein